MGFGAISRSRGGRLLQGLQDIRYRQNKGARKEIRQFLQGNTLGKSCDANNGSGVGFVSQPVDTL